MTMNRRRQLPTISQDTSVLLHSGDASQSQVSYGRAFNRPGKRARVCLSVGPPLARVALPTLQSDSQNTGERRIPSFRTVPERLPCQRRNGTGC